MKCEVVEAAEATEDGQAGERAVELGGYQQELKRTLGSFQVFAISFAFISVAVGRPPRGNGQPAAAVRSPFSGRPP